MEKNSLVPQVHCSYVDMLHTRKNGPKPDQYDL